MSNVSIKKVAKEMFEKYMGIKITLKMITLLESFDNGVDCERVFFAVGNCAYYYDRLSGFYAYPNWEGTNGMFLGN